MPDKKSLQFHMNLGLLIKSTHYAITKRFVKNAHESGFDISLDQWMVLGPIWQSGDASHKELGELCLKDKTSITRIINALEKKSLVVRVQDQIDHRIKRVVLTNSGKQLFYDVLPVMERTREEVNEGITDQEIENIKNTLSRIIYNLENE